MNSHSLRGPLLKFAALLPLLLSAGCYEPLALQDPYFALGSPNAAAHGADALQAVRYNRALQSARRSCPAAPPPAVDAPGGPGRAATRRAALARLCPHMPAPSVAALGSSEGAYRRWIEDRVRELPEASATAAGAAGGS